MYRNVIRFGYTLLPFTCIVAPNSVVHIGSFECFKVASKAGEESGEILLPIVCVCVRMKQM